MMLTHICIILSLCFNVCMASVTINGFLCGVPWECSSRWFVCVGVDVGGYHFYFVIIFLLSGVCVCVC